MLTKTRRRVINISINENELIRQREIFHFLFRPTSQVSFKTADADTVAGLNLHKAPYRERERLT